MGGQTDTAISEAAEKMARKAASHGAKVKRGQLNAVQRGCYGTGPAPFGYRRTKDGKRSLDVNEEEAETVKRIFREYLRTKSTGRVVRILNSEGIPTRKGKRWSRQAISIILTNRTYRGRVRYGDLDIRGQHEPIIDASVFYKASALKRRRSRARKRVEAK
jgi:DNA invertase Pin-like site-specific DNA recombinase